MERVLIHRPARRAAAPHASPGAATPIAFLAPGAAPGEWELARPRTGGGHPAIDEVPATRQTFASLEAAAVNLEDAERFVLALPLSLGLVQRLTLPPAEPGELEDMARIQLEKILPYPVESVSMALTEIARSDSEVTVTVDMVQADRLAALCQPLVGVGAWPLRVVFHVRALAASAPAAETAAFLCREEGRSVLGICEDGKLGFAQASSIRRVRSGAEGLAAELPAVLLGAELEGVPTNFGGLSLDGRIGEWSDVLRTALNLPVEPFDAGRAALRAAAAARSGEVGDLSLPGWRTERLRGERMARLRRRLWLGLGLYLLLLALAFIGIGVLAVKRNVQRAHIGRLRPLADYADASNTHWRKLAPAIDPTHYLTETMNEVYACLPPDSSVLWTGFDLTPRTISIQGEAPSPSAAVDFTDKLKARAGLRMYRFEVEPPAALANGRARFRITGTMGEK